MNSDQGSITLQKNLLLFGAVRVIISSFLPWKVEGDFISTWRPQLFFRRHGNCKSSQLTKRAPDGWDSARFMELVLSDGSFPLVSWFSPAAGNAHR